MANENKKINELVSDDDDPTAELEILAIGADDVELEADANTSGLARKAERNEEDSIPVLKSDLESRSKTIGRLQFDIEQLRAKWLGLEAEISAREDITKELNRNLADMRGELNRKEQSLRDRDETIDQLEAQIRSLDDEKQTLQDAATNFQQQIEEEREAYKEADVVGLRKTLMEKEHRILELEDGNGMLTRRVESLEKQQTQDSLKIAEQSGRLASNETMIKRLRRNETRLEEYADSIRHQLMDTQAASGEALESHEKLHNALASATAEIEELQSSLDSESAAGTTLRQELDQLQNTHADEVRRIRSELSEALESKSSLRKALDDFAAEISELKANLDHEAAAGATLKQELERQQKSHTEEIRQIRFELGEAQETVAQNELVNEQLASDLVETRNHRLNLEDMLSKSEEINRSEIDNLERENRKLKMETEQLEEKLASKTEAINTLLAELAKKTEQIDSIGEIEEVIQEIDGRMSERIDERGSAEKDRLARLLVGSVEGQELRFPLFKERLTIGRTDQNDIQLKAAYISRRHAVIATEGDVTRIIDWGSKNGVFVNSNRVTEHFLKHGDIVAIGTAKFRYEERQKRDS